MWVRFTTDMREETLLRCLIAVFVALGGVPWVVTTDTMKTVAIGRNADNQPIWHPAFAKCAAEFGFHPDACSQGAGNQKGSVENLVRAALEHPFSNGVTGGHVHQLKMIRRTGYGRSSFALLRQRVLAQV